MHSLRTKITAVTVAAILASLIAAAAAGFLTVGQEVNSSSAEKMSLLGEVAQQSLDAYLNDLEQAVETTAQTEASSLDSLLLVECGSHDAIENRTAEQTARLDAYLAKHSDSVSDLFGRIASNANGVVSYFYCIEPNMSAKEHGFYFLRTGKVGFEEGDPIDISKLDSNDRDHNSWYFTVEEQGIPVWVGPYKNAQLDDALTVTYITPVYCAGTRVGYLGMDILFSTMVDQIDSLKVYSSGYACLVDDRGHVLYHPDYGVAGAFDASAEVFSPEVLDGMDSGNKTVLYEKGGETWQMSHQTLINGMKLVVTAPMSEIAASWNRLVGIVPLIGLAILAFFIPLVLLATGAVTKPLQQLTSGARRLATGDYEIELDYHGDDEVGELTDAFRSLREHLQVYTSNLSSSTFSDELTGVKNDQAFSMYAAQVNDAISHMADNGDTQFALVIVDCLDLRRIQDEFGQKWVEANVKAICRLVCKIYSEASVFRVGDQRFLAFLQGRNYANREELLCDFDIWTDEINAEVTEPWEQIHVAKGMATYRMGVDSDVSAVVDRAIQRAEHS